MMKSLQLACLQVNTTESLGSAGTRVQEKNIARKKSQSLYISQRRLEFADLLRSPTY
jgi:hypothetical protein